MFKRLKIPPMTMANTMSHRYAHSALIFAASLMLTCVMPAMDAEGTS